jgi:hypothetical protein
MTCYASGADVNGLSAWPQHVWTTWLFHMFEGLSFRELL